MKVGQINFPKIGKGNFKRWAAGIGASIFVLGALPGCSNTNTNDTPAVTSEDPSITETPEETEISEAEAIEKVYETLRANDTYLSEDFIRDVTTVSKDLENVIRNDSAQDMQSVVLVSNIDEIFSAGKGVLIDTMRTGVTPESIYEDFNSVVSQIRESNNVVTNSADYHSFANLSFNEQDRNIIASLELTLKDIIDLKAKENPTEEEQKRLQDDFDQIDGFLRGVSTIQAMSEDGLQDFAKADLSNGGELLAEQVGHTMVEIVRNYVSDEKREDLSKNVLTGQATSNFYEKANTIMGMVYTESLTANMEKVDEVVTNYTNTINILAPEVAEAAGVTKAEAESLCTLMNFEHLFSVHSGDTYPMNKLYPDGADMHQILTEAESALGKLYGTDYQLGRFIIDPNGEQVYAAISKTTEIVRATASSDSVEATQAANDVRALLTPSNESYTSYLVNNQVYRVDRNTLPNSTVVIMQMLSAQSMAANRGAYANGLDQSVMTLIGVEDALHNIQLEMNDRCAGKNIVTDEYHIGSYLTEEELNNQPTK